MEIQVLIDPEKCIGCGGCALDCPIHAIEIQNEKAVLLNQHCLKCGHCFAVCPEHAVRLDGHTDEIREMSGKPVFPDEKSLKTHMQFRRSVRQYKKIPVETEKLEKMIDAGRLAPTASNSQNVRYIVIQSEIHAIEDAVLALYEKTGERGFIFRGAPAAILVISPSEINACLAAMNMELMAAALGLGTLHVGLFTHPANSNEKMRSLLGVTAEERIAACLAVGYPRVQYLRSVPRKKAEIIWK